MITFKPCDLVKCYTMLKNHETSLICTKGIKDNQYNITPYGWFMTMDYEPVTKIIISSDPNHQAVQNIKRTNEFAICMPLNENDIIIEQCGSVSDPNINKFEKFNIEGKKADKTDLMIPYKNVSGWIECKLIKIQREGSVDLIMGEAVQAFIRT